MYEGPGLPLQRQPGRLIVDYYIPVNGAKGFGIRNALFCFIMIHLILLVFALVLFILSAIPVPARINLMGAGLACWVAAQLVSGAAPLLR